MNGDARPIIHCLAAYIYGDGKLLGSVHYVSLETAAWMKEIGYAILVDPHDQIDLATWEREQHQR